MMAERCIKQPSPPERAHQATTKASLQCLGSVGALITVLIRRALCKNGPFPLVACTRGKFRVPLGALSCIRHQDHQEKTAPGRESQQRGGRWCGVRERGTSNRYTSCPPTPRRAASSFSFSVLLAHGGKGFTRIINCYNITDSQLSQSLCNVDPSCLLPLLLGVFLLDFTVDGV